MLLEICINKYMFFRKKKYFKLNVSWLFKKGKGDGVEEWKRKNKRMSLNKN